MAAKIPIVDLSPFFTADRASDEQLQRGAAEALVQACRDLGFVTVVGHGLAADELRAAFAGSKALFDLPYAEKMKAPHPPGNMPHRGYSGLGVEKVYSKEEAAAADQTAAAAAADQRLRTISDYKESYEIGSEADDQQTNIWLPDPVLPPFRPAMTALYERLAAVCCTILEAFSLGLRLDPSEHTALMDLISARHCQLRLLHYPAISRAKLQTEMLARLPAHHDWGTFTILFQDDRGGLELRDPHSAQFLPAAPEEGALVLNIGDMFQRFTNDYFVSALHRVSVPDPAAVAPDGIPARYSIPFFVAPAPTHVVATLPRFITAAQPAKYEPVRFDAYGALISRYQYQAGDTTQ